MGNARGQTMFSMGDGVAGTVGTLSTPAQANDSVGELQLYDESSDSWVSIPYSKLIEQSRRFIEHANGEPLRRRSQNDPLKKTLESEFGAVLVIRPNIEHWMLGTRLRPLVSFFLRSQTAGALPLLFSPLPSELTEHRRDHGQGWPRLPWRHALGPDRA